MWNFFWSEIFLCLKWRLLIGQDFAELIIFNERILKKFFIILFMNIHEDVTLFDFAPILNLETNAWATMEIHLWFWNLIFEAWVQPYSFTPFDISVKADPIKPQRYCHGIDYYGEALIFKIDYEQEINECHMGMFGWLFPLQEHGN